MLQKIFAAIGVIEILSPERLIDATEQLALENPDECETKQWLIPAARLEGIVYLLLACCCGRSQSAFKTLLGVIGLPALLYPREFIDYTTEIAYTDAEACEWKPWIYPFTRLLGAVYVIIALNEIRNR